MAGRYSDLRRVLRSRWGIGVVAFLCVVTVVLVVGHRTHVAGNNLVLGGLLLACVLMHLFMHGGHGGHGGPRQGGR